MAVKVLVVGSGGREHAMCRALTTTPEVEIFTAPGNPGTAQFGENVDVRADDVAGLVALARRARVDLVIPGPEAPLVAGLADALAEAGIPCCGPSAAAARLEGSKAFTRMLAQAAGIPSPDHRIVTSPTGIAAALAAFESPPVIKADGLAAGKGVFLPDTFDESAQVTRDLLAGSLGQAGATVVMERRLAGIEASWFHACRGNEAITLPDALDHKRLLDGGEGPNTGGMGAVSPNPDVDTRIDVPVRDQFVLPALERLTADGTPFKGFLFSGMMLTEESPYLLEFNVRLGDPEAQVVLPRLPDGVFTEVCAWVAGLRANPPTFEFDRRHTCAVVLAADGYPGAPRRGDPITLSPGLESEDRWFIHAGTRLDNGTLLTDGGRVGAVVARAESKEAARVAAYEGVSRVQWAGMTHRSDIGVALHG
ncbi:MAG: phosphoribosylamine--glycine ligase [Acidimicrobiia bacterium]